MKFQDALTHALYESAMDGYCDDTFGSLAEHGREYCLFVDFDCGDGEIIHAVLVEDDEGYVFADAFPSKESAEMAWDEIILGYDMDQTDSSDWDGTDD